jgi:DNA-binding phage protein
VRCAASARNWRSAGGSATAAGIDVRARLSEFFRMPRPWLSKLKPTSREAVVALLEDLRGNVAIVDLAREAGFSRFAVSRWLKGVAEPRLPDFLRLVEATSLRVLDFVAAFADPSSMPSVAAAWVERQAAREAAFARPWSHAVLRALELSSYQVLPQHQPGFLAERLGITPEEELACLQVLSRARQIHKRDRRWSVRPGVALDLRSETARLAELKAFWIDVARERLMSGAPGAFGFNLFACSEADLQALREMYLAFFQQMQARIARSSPSECVGLFSTQLLQLSRP